MSTSAKKYDLSPTLLLAIMVNESDLNEKSARVYTREGKVYAKDGGLMAVLGAALGNLHNTSPFDVTGNPALSVPCGMSDGRPIGMMLVGRHFDDATVLRAGHAYQRETGTALS